LQDGAYFSSGSPEARVPSFSRGRCYGADPGKIGYDCK
jgi:hypothetical protein